MMAAAQAGQHAAVIVASAVGCVSCHVVLRAEQRFAVIRVAAGGSRVDVKASPTMSGSMQCNQHIAHSETVAS